MRKGDLGDWWSLRRHVENAWEVVRFRNRRRRLPADAVLVARLVDGPELALRAGQSDLHVLVRIFARDEYGLDGVAPGAWDTVIDVGANVGVFTARVAPLARRVIAYEPSPVNFAQVQRNVGGLPGVEVVAEAVAGSPGLVKLHRPADGRHSFCFTLYPEAGLGAQDFDAFDEVKATSLDALFERHRVERCDLLKIDAEGAEYELLHGASDATLAKVRRIYAEYHDVQPEDPRTRIANLVSHLETQGFSVELRPSPRRPNHGLFFARRPGS